MPVVPEEEQFPRDFQTGVIQNGLTPGRPVKNNGRQGTAPANTGGVANGDVFELEEESPPDLEEEHLTPSFDEEETPADRTRAIDATLARFSAVHDQIAIEEEDRRKRYGWLFGKRKEPELGQDMPFDFNERQDDNASRIEWKKKQKKQRTVRLFQVLGAAAVLLVVVVVAVGVM